MASENSKQQIILSKKSMKKMKKNTKNIQNDVFWSENLRKNNLNLFFQFKIIFFLSKK
jgi:hypothetical protein